MPKRRREQKKYVVHLVVSLNMLSSIRSENKLASVVESLFVIDMYQIITIIAGGDSVCVVRV